MDHPIHAAPTKADDLPGYEYGADGDGVPATAVDAVLERWAGCGPDLPLAKANGKSITTAKCEVWAEQVLRIDAVLNACHQCGHSRGYSPSDDFCGERCQYAWHVGAAPVGAFDRPSAGELAYQRAWEQRHAGRPFPGFPAAEPPTYAMGGLVLFHDPVPIRLADITGLDGTVHHLVATDSGLSFLDRHGPQVTVTADMIGDLRAVIAPLEAAFTGLGHAARRTLAGLEAEILDTTAPVAAEDVQRQALELRRHRNTGPPVRRRAPKRIDPQKGH